MRKKLLAAVLSLTLMVGMAVQTMAAPSIVGAIDTPHVSADQGTVTLKEVAADTYPAEVQKVVDQLNAAKAGMTVKDAFGSLLAADTKVALFDGATVTNESMDLSTMKFLSPVMDLTIDGVTPTEENPVTVTFTANNMTANTEVYVLHLCDSHSWELLQTSKVSDNQISAKFHSASPVALVYVDKGTGSSAEGTSPKTGESNAVTTASVIAVIFMAAGVFAVVRGRRAYK